MTSISVKYMNSEILNRLLDLSYQEFNQLKSSNVMTTNTPQSIFDIFFSKCQQYHQFPVHNLQEMKNTHSTKIKGDLFELFCQRYLEIVKGYKKVWLLKELPNELKKKLRLPLGDKDYGIDLIAIKNEEYSAIQCKFKAPRHPIKVKNRHNEIKTIYPSVNWKELATFNELCNVTGPWNQRITMTTASSVRRLGGIKDKRDRSICLKSFKSISFDDWMKLVGVTHSHDQSNRHNLSVKAEPIEINSQISIGLLNMTNVPSTITKNTTFINDTGQTPLQHKTPIKLKSQLIINNDDHQNLSMDELRKQRILYYQDK